MCWSLSTISASQRTWPAVHVLDRWHEELASGLGGSRHQAEEDLAWFRSQSEREACWTCGLGQHHGPAETAAPVDVIPGMGEDWIWWPRGIPTGRRVAIVSSRVQTSRPTLVPTFIGRSNWFKALRLACEQCRIAHDVAMVSEGTTTEAYVRRYAQHIGLKTIRLSAPSSAGASVSLIRWLRHIRQVTARVESVSEYCGYLLPKKLSSVASSQERLAASDRAPPWADAIVVAASDQVRVLSLRPNGNLVRLLQERLMCPACPPGSVWLALGPSLVPYELAEPLVRRGAVGWFFFGGGSADSTDSSPTEEDKDEQSGGFLSTKRDITRIGFPLAELDAHSDESAVLIHCTRSGRGPWPDETKEQHLDRQLMQPSSHDSSAGATLVRILRQRRILATSRTIRGGLSVVSFTAATVSQLAQLHTFRPHRGHWDFEPYAIAIRRDWLVARGTRPVIYADDARWSTLQPQWRPYFQLSTTRGKQGRQLVDWTVEQEWRHWGDLALDELSPADAWVIVPTLAEARVVAAVSPWPVRTLT